jgi:hypothetical protein
LVELLALDGGEPYGEVAELGVDFRLDAGADMGVVAGCLGTGNHVVIGREIGVLIIDFGRHVLICRWLCFLD